MKKICIISLLLMTISVTAFAQQPAIIIENKDGWSKIGETTVGMNTDKDEIIVLGADEFQALKFKVLDTPIELISFEVEYEDDRMSRYDVMSPIKAGEMSRALNLKEGGEIKKVRFVYKNVYDNRGEKAKVELYGLK